MGRQSHKIKREVLELGAPRVDLAKRAQADVSRIHASRIAPVIEEVCTEVSSPDRIHRISRLELDLGSIAASRFEVELPAKLAVALRRALGEEIRAQDRGDARGEGSRYASLLELFACFARTGSLPWWADSGRAGLLDEAARALLREAPRAFAEAARELLREPDALRRIAATYADPVLAVLCGLLCGGPEGRALSALPPALARLSRDGKLGAGLSGASSLRAAWRAALAVAARAGEAQRAGPDRAVALCKEALTGFAGSIKLPYGELLSILHQAKGQPDMGSLSDQAPLADIIDRLHAQHSGAGRRPAARPFDWAELTQAIASLADRPPVGRAARWRELLRAIEPPPGEGGEPGASAAHDAADLRSDWKGIRMLLARALSSGRLSAELLERCLSDLAAIHDAGAAPEARDVPRPLRGELATALREAIAQASGQAREKAEPLGADAREADADDRYVNDAGLVLLWPFLSQLLQNLGLLDDRRFKDPEAQRRAVALLHYLATEGRDPAEYQLCLAKVLSGLDAADLIEPGEPITDAEAEECEHFLKAVIAQAPILNNMSVPLFQATFLQRLGLLTAEDGAWLLRVERETHDVVLDLFPWSFQWAALPWMGAPLRVEWR